MTNRFMPRDNREARGSHHEHIRRLIGMLVLPILTAHMSRDAASAFTISPESIPLLAACARLTNAPLKLVTRKSTEDQGAAEKRG